MTEEEHTRGENMRKGKYLNVENRTSNDKTEKWSHVSVTDYWGFLEKKKKNHLKLFCKLHTWALGCQNVITSRTPSGTPSHLLPFPRAATFFLVSRPPRRRGQPAACHKRPRADSEVLPGGPCNLSWRISPKPFVSAMSKRAGRPRVTQDELWQNICQRNSKHIFCWRE